MDSKYQTYISPYDSFIGFAYIFIMSLMSMHIIYANSLNRFAYSNIWQLLVASFHLPLAVTTSTLSIYLQHLNICLDIMTHSIRQFLYGMWYVQCSMNNIQPYTTEIK